jgi:bifunctional ADP-heptose synthase (sugar kinase/adenylyltransferase)
MTTKNTTLSQKTGYKAAQAKIVTLDELEKICQSLRKQGKTIVHCHGVFDLLHPGHFLHFEAARKEGDVLIVTLTQDQYLRFHILTCISV